MDAVDAEEDIKNKRKKGKIVTRKNEGGRRGDNDRKSRKTRGKNVEGREIMWMK